MAKKQQNTDLDDLIFSVPNRLERLWEEIRIPLFWSLAAVISMGILVSLSVTPKGGERLAQIPYDMQDIIAKQNAGASLSAALDKRFGDVREENLQLAAARAKLEMRVAQLEDSVGDITASIPKAPKTAAVASPLADSKTAVTIPDDGMKGKGAMTLATRSEFGIDLGPSESLRSARTAWVKLMEQYGSLMTGYEPLISVQDADDNVPLHLVVGPFSNLAEAASACAKLKAAGLASCAPVPYEGQRMALR